MRGSEQKSAPRWMLAILAATLLVRAFIPVGYMPGNLLAGEFARLCPTGLPAPLGHAGHHGAHHETELSADKACPVGLALKFAALPTAFIETLPSVVPESFAVPQPGQPVDTLTLAPFRARAPPAGVRSTV